MCAVLLLLEKESSMTKADAVGKANRSRNFKTSRTTPYMKVQIVIHSNKGASFIETKKIDFPDVVRTTFVNILTRK